MNDFAIYIMVLKISQNGWGFQLHQVGLILQNSSYFGCVDRINMPWSTMKVSW